MCTLLEDPQKKCALLKNFKIESTPFAMSTPGSARALCARECTPRPADVFETRAERWGSGMPRPGDVIHSAQADGVDARLTRKRNAAGIKRSLAEVHAHCTSSNLSDARSNRVMDAFCNVRMF